MTNLGKPFTVYNDAIYKEEEDVANISFYVLAY